MKRLVKWLVGVVLVLILGLGAVALALQHWVGSEDFRGRTARQLSGALGVPVQLGGISVDVWPLPAVALDQVQVKSQPPLTLERIEARPVWAGLLRGRLEVATLVVRNAVVPEQAVTAIMASYQKAQRTAGRAEPGKTSGGGMAFLPRRTLLEQVTWVPARGARMTVDVQARLDDDGLPASASVDVLKGRFEGAKATLLREPGHWTLKAAIGGGTVSGKLQLRTGARGGSLLQGQFDTANVEVSALTAPSRTLTGRLEAHTTLRVGISRTRRAGRRDAKPDPVHGAQRRRPWHRPGQGREVGGPEPRRRDAARHAGRQRGDAGPGGATSPTLWRPPARSRPTATSPWPRTRP